MRVFATVERIRQISIQFRRDDDETARAELVATLNSLSRDRTIEVVRAFAHFSHLANIAEDEHNIRSARAEERLEQGPREGTIACALGRAKAANVSRSQLQNILAGILVSPVLTAHPTEVRRQSVIDREMEVARLLAARDASNLTPRECAGIEEDLRRAVLTLWQTSLLRHDRPSVIDEVTNNLSYYNHTFLRELPRLYADIEDQLSAYDPAFKAADVPSFIRMGSWIGGDRDGNPFVDADVLSRMMSMQSKRVLDFYLDV